MKALLVWSVLLNVVGWTTTLAETGSFSVTVSNNKLDMLLLLFMLLSSTGDRAHARVQDEDQHQAWFLCLKP